MDWKVNFDKLPKLLGFYSNEDYIQQQRAKFIFYLCLALLTSIVIVIISRLLFHPLSIRYDPSHIRVLLPVVLLMLSVLACLIILIKGYYNAAANMLPAILMTIIWIIIYFERQSLLIQFDTIVYIFAALTIVPLLVRKNTFIIVAYPLINIIALIVFILIVKEKVGITRPEMWDYFIDVSISLAFVGFIGHSIYSINSKALQNAEAFNRKKDEAESALYQSEKRYREMALLLPQTVYESDNKGFLTYINKAGTEMFGYTDEDISMGLNVMNTFVKEDRERVYLNFLDVVNGKPSNGQRYMALRKDGTSFPVEIYSAPIVDQGKNIGARGIIYDISERIKSEEELKKSHALFKTLVDFSPFSTTLVDMDGRLLMANYAFSEYADISKDEIIGKSATELGVSLENSGVVSKALLSVGFIRNFESTLILKSGIKKDIILSSCVVDVNDSKAILTSIIDISDRKNLEKKLIESETLFRTMVNMAPYSINIIDGNNKFTLANDAFFKKYNMTLDDIKGKDFEEAGFKIEEEDARDISYAFRENGEVIDMEMGITTPTNEKVYSMVSMKPILIENEPHFLLTTFDITDRKLLEDKLLDYNQRLEDLVRERTEELATAVNELKKTNLELDNQRKTLEQTLNTLEETQSHLIETEKMASLGILTAGVAHEINNPLNYIFNGAIAIEKHLEEKCPDQVEELKPLFEAINSGIDRTAEIVKSLNKYSTKEQKTFKKCNVHEILDSCLVMLHNQYKNNIEIVKDYQEGLPFVMGREGKLHQVFLNILINAIHAIEGKGIIRIKTSVDTSSICVSISDTGKGISTDNLKYIFDPFFTTKDPGKGTGLGLSITQKVVQEHNGTIICKSKVDEGSEFIINLPLKQ
jgi:PAS domain S-box-containing protein